MLVVAKEQEPEQKRGVFSEKLTITPDKARELIENEEVSFPDLENLPGFEPPAIERETEKAFWQVWQNWQTTKDNGKK